MKLKQLLLLLFTAFIAACSGEKKDDNATDISEGGGTYYSIRSFVKDQWELNRGIPYTFIKIVIHEGKRDTSYESAFKMELGEVMQKFVNTDISDKKYLGKYNFNLMDDAASDTRSYYYEANDPELYTQKLEIITDPANDRIRSVYIEAAEHSGWTRTSLKLYYAPKKVIQVQERKKSRFGKAEETITEYRFPVSE